MDRLIRINVILHSYLREKFPPEAGGRGQVQLPQGSRLEDLAAALDLPKAVHAAVNGQIVRNRQTELQDGDEVRFFHAGSGGR